MVYVLHYIQNFLGNATNQSVSEKRGNLKFCILKLCLRKRSKGGKTNAAFT